MNRALFCLGSQTVGKKFYKLRRWENQKGKIALEEEEGGREGSAVVNITKEGNLIKRFCVLVIPVQVKWADC